MKAYESLIQYCLLRQQTLSVWDGDSWALIKSSSYTAIMAAIGKKEEVTLKIFNGTQNVASVLVNPNDNVTPSSFLATICDWRDNGFLDDWVYQYQNATIQ